MQNHSTHKTQHFIGFSLKHHQHQTSQPTSQPSLWRNYFTARCQNYQIFLDQIRRKISDKLEIFEADGDADVR